MVRGRIPANGYTNLDICVTACLLDYWGHDADAFRECVDACIDKYGKRGKRRVTKN